MPRIQQFSDTFTLDDFELLEGATADNSYEINDQNFQTVYYKQFEKGEGMILGQGREENQTDAIGRLYAEFDEDAAVDIPEGKLRFVVLNRQFNLVRVISQWDLDAIARGASSPGDREPFAVQERTRKGERMVPVAVSYPRVLAMQMKVASGTANVDDAEAGTTAKIDGLRVEETA